jgi:hypothetical protein
VEKLLIGDFQDFKKNLFVVDFPGLPRTIDTNSGADLVTTETLSDSVE